MAEIEVDFNKPSLVGKELTYIQQAIEQRHISGDGKFTRLCQEYLQHKLGVNRVLLATNCTHALEIAAFLLNIQPGDEILVPSFTFVSTVNAFVIRGARPLFVDIRPDTLNLDENLLESKITRRTRAILPVHYAGVGCEMDAILEIADKHKSVVIEDNAHGLFGKYRGRYLGTFGALATQSFHETKNITCGEGGALLINDPQYIERAEIIREKGTNRSRFFRGMVDKYTWVDQGSSYVLSDLLAAFLYAQLEVSCQIQAARQRIWQKYDHDLRDWAAQHGVQTPQVPQHCEQPYHMYYLVMPELKVRQAFIAHLKNKRILSVFHYLPLHLSDMGQKFGGKPGDCPVTESISDRLVRLPFYNSLDEKDQLRVIDAIHEFKFI